MPRSIEISTSPETVDSLVKRLRKVDGVISISRQRGVVVGSAGDVLTVQTTNEACRAVLRTLDEVELADDDSVVTSEPRSVLSRGHLESLDTEGNETIWEEMAFMLRRNTNVEQNYLILMALAGAVAAVGLWKQTVYIVVGGMIVAPAFEALTRIPFGFIGGPRRLAWRGLQSTAFGYLLMAAGAGGTFFLLQLLDPSGPSELAGLPLIRLWSTLEPTGVVLALLGGAAGATIVAAQRPVLSTGVQITLALIPSISIVGMALASGELPLAGRAFVRWSVEVGLILLSNALVFGVKQSLVQRRRALG